MQPWTSASLCLLESQFPERSLERIAEELSTALSTVAAYVRHLISGSYDHYYGLVQWRQSYKNQTVLAVVQSRGGDSSHASTPTVTLNRGGVVPGHVETRG